MWGQQNKTKTQHKTQPSPSGLADARTAYPYLDSLEARLDGAMSDRRIVGLVAAVIEQGEPVFVYTHGETVAGSGDAVTRETLFRAASVSKTFTGTLLGMLEADGVIDLAAPVALVAFQSALEEHDSIQQVTFVCFDDANFQTYRALLEC